MKKIYLLALLVGAFSFSAHAQFPLDDIESYPLGTIHTGHWISWDGNPSADDLSVSDDEAFSGSKSILVPEGGTVDGVLDLGNKISGVWKVEWKMFIPTGKSAYINMQNVLPAGTEFNFHIYWNEGGTTEGDAILYDASGANQGNGATLGFATYTPDTWFDVSLSIDLDNETMSVTMDGNIVADGIAYPYPNATAPGIGGIDFYSNESNGESNRYYVDDVVYSDLLSANNFSAESFSMYPNPVKDVLNISTKTAVNNVTVYDILGKVVLTAQPDAISPKIDMSSLTSGAYLVKVTIGNSSKTVKVLK